MSTVGTPPVLPRLDEKSVARGNNRFLATFLLGLTLTTAALPVSAADINMLGAGKLSCKEWQTLRGSKEYFSAGNWVLGFLSGSAWDSGQDLLARQKPERLFRFIDNWCTTRQDQTLSDATVALAYHLLETHKPAK